MAKLPIKTWYAIHKWTSLVCTIFLLIICVTGLPLVFHHEIEHWLDDAKPYAQVPEGTARASLDGMVATAMRMFPNELIEYVYIDDEEPQVYLGMTPNRADKSLNHALRFDAHTGEVVKAVGSSAQDGHSFMDVMLRLHVDLFADLPGELFLGFMGLLFVVAVVSGVVLYGPFMKKIEFGTVRGDRSTRIKWLDLHNLLGVVTLVWAFVVGLTGVINELSTPMFRYWQSTALQGLLEPHRGKPTPQLGQLASLDAIAETVSKTSPGMTLTSVTFPGNAYGSPYHFVTWSKGQTPLTSRLFSPSLLDAQTGKLAAQVEMPWYLRALEVSRPLHFGDYGGMPLKIIWALLDVVTIIVLGSGLYLWIARRRSAAARIAELEARHKAWASARA